MSTRNWNGYTKPINVYYKMTGGGASFAALSGSSTFFGQFAAAGGSSAILKNGGLVAFGPGQTPGAASRTVRSGTFTVSSGDTLLFILGGGGGGGLVSYRYTGSPGYEYFGISGGGGAGYYGGGGGAFEYSNGVGISAGVSTATGGTGTAGGTSAAGGLNGSLYNGGRETYSGYGAYGGSGTAQGAYTTIGHWTGYGWQAYQMGGGGGQGRTGNPSGVWGCPADPAAATMPPTATDFELSPGAGKHGYIYNAVNPLDGVSYNCNAGGGYGEIVLQYQAPTCDLIPQYNQD
ncbi:hypothetical protein FN976_10945 [Caenimonas sedimenti]|uniref:Uncharacterized protein n=2 Tax=Caenimonas sedimenti TaxID=2596921 RepID=A0A562ZSP5_9BURK|nr:hypothetical protein FN976_10945 [Caenimonas sedimenti]